MNRILATAAIFMILAPGCRPPSARNDKDPAPATLVLKADCRYNLSHGWGHVFRCSVSKVIAGSLAQKEIQLHVYGTVHQYGGLLLPFDPAGCGNLLLSFKASARKHGPPPGFRDGTGSYWEIISVEKNH